MACLVRVNGGVWSYPLPEGKDLLPALQSAVGGSTKTYHLDDGRRVVSNSQGHELGLRRNERIADMVGLRAPAKEGFFGDCVLCAPGEIESVLDESNWGDA